MNKPAFDPTQPYEVAGKPPFDPAQPYKVAGPAKPSMFQQRVAKFGETMDDPSVTKAEKGIALIGQSAGYMGDVAGKAVSAVIPDFIGKGISSVFEKLIPYTNIPELYEAGKGLSEKYPRLTRDVGNMLNIASVLPVGKIGNMAVEGIAKPALAATGKVAERAGKGWLQSQLKINKPTAMRAYGKNLVEKKNSITNDIVEFGLHKSPNFSEMNKTAMQMVSDLDAQGKVIAKQVEEAQIQTAQAMAKAAQAAKINRVVARMKPGDPRIAAEKAKILAENLPAQPKQLSNPVAMVLNAERDMIVEAPYGQGEKVQSVVRSIVADMKKDGMNQNVPISRLIEAKKKIIGDGKIFKLGPAPSTDDMMNAAIRKDIVYRFLDKVGELSPELRAIGKQQKRLIDIAHVADEAASRIANKDPMGLAARIILGGSFPAAATALATGNPKVAAGIMLGGLGQYGLERSVSQGAGPRKLIRAGKMFGKIGEPAKRYTIGNMRSK